jgi:glucan-binding YG repeat protein
MHGHSEEDELKDAQKPYVCTIGYCNKRYKNLNGLKYHIEHSHIAKLKQQSLDIQPWQAFSNH